DAALLQLLDGLQRVEARSKAAVELRADHDVAAPQQSRQLTTLWPNGERHRARHTSLDEHFGELPALLETAAFDAALLLVEANAVALLLIGRDARIPIDSGCALLGQSPSFG